MLKDGTTSSQDWRALAEQASREQNPERLRQLVAELCDLLEAQFRNEPGVTSSASPS